MRRWRIAAWLADAALIAAAWAGALIAENVALGFLWRDQFSGIWEIALGRRAVVPLALAGLALPALAVAAAWRVTGIARRRRWARRALGAAGAIAAAALAVGVTQGRHFASWGVRGLFVGALTLAGAWAAARGLPRLAALRRRPLGLAALGLAAGVAAWTADAYVLPRLYPAFHAALGAGTLLGVALVGLAARSAGARPTRLERAFALAMGGVALGCALSVPGDLRALDRAANVRRVLVEHAPLLGSAAAAATPFLPSQAEGRGRGASRRPGPRARSRARSTGATTTSSSSRSTRSARITSRPTATAGARRRTSTRWRAKAPSLRPRTAPRPTRRTRSRR